MKNALIFFFLIIINFSGYCQDPTLTQAAEAFGKKDYQKSIQLYETILKDHPSSAEVRYNLGNAYLATNQIAKAIVNYEKALLYKPGNKDILHNLAIANDKIENPITNINNFFLSTGYWHIVHQFRSISFMVSCILMTILLLLAIAFLLFKETRLLKKYQWIWSTLLLLIIGVLFKLYTDRNHLENGSQAIIMQESQLKSGADQSSQTLQEIDPGIKAVVLDSIGTWYKLNLPDKEQGWLEKSKVEVVR